MMSKCRVAAVSLSEGSVVKHQVGPRLPDEVLDRPEVHVGVQHRVVAQQLHPLLRAALVPDPPS